MVCPSAVRIGLLYVISGFGGSLMSALFIQNGISVGASGALFGLLGSMLSELITNWTIYANKVNWTPTILLLFCSISSILAYCGNYLKVGHLIWLIAVSSIVDSSFHHPVKPSCRDTSTRRQLCSLRGIFVRILNGVCVSYPSPIRVRQQEKDSSGMYRGFTQG